MTYEQALAYVRSKYGTTPWTSVSGLDLLRDLTQNGVSYSMASDINKAYYTAKRTNSTIDSVLQSQGTYTPAAATTTTQSAGTVAPIQVPTFTSPFAPTPSPTPTQEVPVVSASTIFNQPVTPAPAPAPVSTISVPTITAPSLLASQESGAIGAASIANQLAPQPAHTPAPPPTIPTVYRTDREVIQDGKRYYVMSDGSYRLAADQSNITPVVTTTTDERDRLRAQMGLPPLSTTTATTPIQVPSTATAPSVPTVPVITVPKLPDVAAEVPVEAPVVANPLPAPSAPAGPIPVIQAPAMPVTTTTPTAPQMGGSLEDQINYQSAIRRLTAQLGLSRESAKQQAGEVRAQYETQLRKAARDRYAAQVKAIASLGARGISGAPGLSVAARRAGGAEADYRRLGLIGERERQLSALNRTLTQQLADYEEELRRNQEQLTRATTLANQLTGANQ